MVGAPVTGGAPGVVAAVGAAGVPGVVDVSGVWELLGVVPGPGGAAGSGGRLRLDVGCCGGGSDGRFRLEKGCSGVEVVSGVCVPLVVEAVSGDCGVPLVEVPVSEGVSLPLG